LPVPPLGQRRGRGYRAKAEKQRQLQDSSKHVETSSSDLLICAVVISGLVQFS